MDRALRPRPAAVFFAALAVLVACAEEPTRPDIDTWRGVLRRALAELRAADPPRAERLEELLQRAETAEAAVGGRRSIDRASRAWEAAMSEAASGVMEVRRARSAEAAVVRRRIDAAAKEVALADVRATGAGSSRDDARAVQAARLRLRVAESLAESGNYAAAGTAADDAIALADAAQAGWRRQRDRVDDPELREHWSLQVAETVEASRRQGRSAVIVDKAARRLRVYRSGREVAVFRAEIGTAGLAPKRHAGDRATPEGRYRVTTVKTGGATRYYKALLLDYPNADDRRRFELERAAGTIEAGIGPGSLIEIHGHGGQGRDWTEGCVALRDEDMDRLLDMVGVGTPVTIVGRME